MGPNIKKNLLNPFNLWTKIFSGLHKFYIFFHHYNPYEYCYGMAVFFNMKKLL